MRLETITTNDDKKVVIGFEDFDSCVEYATENGGEIVYVTDEDYGWHIVQAVDEPLMRDYWGRTMFAGEYEFYGYYDIEISEIKEMLGDPINMSTCRDRLKNLMDIEWHVKALKGNKAILLTENGEYDKTVDLYSMYYEDNGDIHAVGVVLPE